MKVKKNSNTVSYNVIFEGNLESLLPDQEYEVYGIEVIDGQPHYMIMTEGDWTPRYFSIENFEITDNHKSKHWESEKVKGGTRLLHPDWFGNEDYMEWFFNGRPFLELEDWEFPEGLELFLFYKDLIDSE